MEIGMVFLCIFAFIMFYILCFIFWELWWIYLPNFVIECRLPKSKKYEGKEAPLYQIKRNYLTTSTYNIHKYNLSYALEEDVFLIFLSVIIPLPIKFSSFCYVRENYIHTFSATDYELVRGKDIIDVLYEEGYKRDKRIRKEKNKERDAYISILDGLNDKFNKNYIK